MPRFLSISLLRVPTRFRDRSFKIGAAISLLLAIFWVFEDISQLVNRQGHPLYLEMEYISNRSSFSQVYWDAGTGYREGFSSKHRIRASETWQTLALPIKGYEIQQLRFDPMQQEGTFYLQNVRLRTLGGRTLATFRPENFRPSHQIESVTMPAPGVLSVQTAPGARDPHLILEADYPFHATLGRVAQGLHILLYLTLTGLGVLLLWGTLYLESPRRPRTLLGLLLALWVVGLSTYWLYTLRLAVIPLPQAVWQALLLGVLSYPSMRLMGLVGRFVTKLGPSSPETPETFDSPAAPSRVPRLFLLLGLAFGTLFTFLTPPYQSPDEIIWFHRIYDISEGNFFPRMIEVEHEDKTLELRAGAYLPAASFAQHSHELRGPHLTFRPHEKITLDQVSESWDFALDRDNRSFYSLADTLHSLPPYLPQAGGVALARSFGLPLTGQFYAGRLANLLVIIGLGYLTLRLTPQMHWSIATLLLGPMALFLTASHSHDPMVTSLCLLTFAAILAFREKEGPFQRWQWGALLALFFLILISKFNYLVLLPLTLLLPWSKFPSIRDWGITQAMLWGLPLLGALALLAVVQVLPGGTWGQPDIDRGERLAETLAAPFQSLWMLLRSLDFSGPEYLRQMAGVLGWLDTDIGRFFRWSWGTALAMALIADTQRPWRNPLLWLERLGLGLLVGLSVLSIMAIFLLTWTTAEEDFIGGVQGRYFLPLVPLLATALIWRVSWCASSTRWWNRLTVLFILLTLIGTSWHLWQRYWVPF